MKQNGKTINYIELEQKKEYYNNNKHRIPEDVINKINEDFIVQYTYDSCGLEGSTLSKEEVRLILEGKIKIPLVKEAPYE
jgi:hypothetical protein